MSNLFCPLKSSNPQAWPGPGKEGVDSRPWECDGEQCAWWTKTQEQCAIRSINMGLWALNEKLEKLPEELTTRGIP